MFLKKCESTLERLPSKTGKKSALLCCFEYEMDKLWMFSLVCKCAIWHLMDLSDVAPCKYGEEHPVEATGAHYRSEQTSSGFTSPSLGLLHGYKAAQTSEIFSFTLKLMLLHLRGNPLLLSDLTISFVICLSIIWTDTDKNEPVYFIQILFFGGCFHLSDFPVYF